MDARHISIRANMIINPFENLQIFFNGMFGKPMDQRAVF